MPHGSRIVHHKLIARHIQRDGIGSVGLQLDRIHPAVGDRTAQCTQQLIWTHELPCGHVETHLQRTTLILPDARLIESVLTEKLCPRFGPNIRRRIDTGGIPALVEHFRKPESTVKNWLHRARNAGMVTAPPKPNIRIVDPPPAPASRPPLDETANLWVADCRAKGLLPPRSEPVVPAGEIESRVKSRLERLLHAYEPDLCLCFGYPWLLPPDLLAVPLTFVSGCGISLRGRI